MVDPKIPSAQRKSRDAEDAEKKMGGFSVSGFLSASSASLLFLCADGIFNPA
jgi:hypothetical protein